MQRNKYEVFHEFVEEEAIGKRVCIVTHPTPDPDAIGAALGISYLMEEKYGLSADIYYDGQLSHPQNQTEVNILDIRLKRYEEFDAEKYGIFVAVDTTPENTGRFGSDVEEWHMCFDHHHAESDAPVTDIRNVGSSCSLVWEYLEHFQVSMGTEQGAVVATALLFGLLNDTDNLMSDNVTETDYEAHAHLARHVDRKKFQAIINHPLPPYLFELRSLAAQNMVIDASLLISYLGILSDKRRDALPIIADEFLRMEGVETVVVFAMIDDTIQASVRSRNSSLSVYQFCQRVFGQEHAGGKQGSGGARVPIGFLYSAEDDIELKQKLSDFVKDTITKRIIRHLTGE